MFQNMSRDMFRESGRGGWVWGGGVPLPTVEVVQEGVVPPPQKMFRILSSKSDLQAYSLSC